MTDDLDKEWQEHFARWREEAQESLNRGLEDSAAGRVKYLGDFTQYAEGDAPVEWDEADLELNGGEDDD